MTSLKVSEQEARIIFERVPHLRFQHAVSRNWKVDREGAVDGRSVCWLYCWAKTGMSSLSAAEASREVFDRVLTTSFDRFNAVVDHEWARRARYSSDRSSVESELAKVLD